MSKDEKCMCKASKNTVFHCQIRKFVGFLLPSSSWLLKLTNVAKRFVKGEGEATLHEGKEQNLHQGRKLVIFMCLNNVCPRLYVTTGFVLYCLKWVATIVAVKHQGALDSRARTKTRSGTKHSVFATTKSSNFFVFNQAGTTKLIATTLSRHHCHGFEHAHNEQKEDLVVVLVFVLESKAL